MTLTAAHLSPIIALAAGILILIVPRLLNYVIAIYLIVIGIIGLNGMACTRFRRHQVRCFNGTGGASWSGGSLRGSSSLRLFG